MLGRLALSILCLAMSTNAVVAGNVRLAGSRHSNQGRVVVNLNGRWGTVCSSYWTITEAKVVCRELGLPEATVVLHEAVFFPTGNAFISMILDYCVGTEPSLVNCSHTIAINPSFCSERYKEVGVVCGKARDEAFLVGGLSPNQGRLDVFLNGRYGSVCDDTWTMKEGQVVCGMLGYSKTTHVVKNHFFGFYWTLSIVMGKVKCRGNESSLFECSFVEESDSCETASVGLVCGRLSVKAQLVGGRSPNEGRIELAFGQKHMGMRKPWTLFSDSNWTIEDAAVICRMLGYQDAMFSVGADMFAEGDGMFFLLQDLNCHGNESSLADCNYSGLREHSLSSEVGVICGKRNDTSIPLRLAGGPSSNLGRVELNLNGHWGTVCHNKWSLNNARVVCRSLGLQEATIATVGSVFGPGNGRIVLDHVECTGNESSLLECRHDKLGFKSCSSEEEAGVLCGKPDVRFQLTGNGSTRNQGVVRVSLNGLDGSICNEGWDTNDATVLCRTLGISDVGYPVNNQAFGPANGVTLLRNVFCHGNETDIMLCDRTDIGTKLGCSHGNDAGVICGPTKARLVGGPTWNHGRVEINIEGVWNRAVWGEMHDGTVPEVICKMIGLPVTGYSVSIALYSTNSTDSSFVSDIKCYKTKAKSILECPFKYRKRIASPKDYQVTCGPPTGNASILNVTSNTSYISQPENALDDDPDTCSFVNTKQETFLTVTLDKDVYIHSVFVIVHNQKSVFEVIVQPIRIIDKSISCTSASKFKTKQGQIFKCSPPTLAIEVRIKVISTNATFGLCNVDVFVFENTTQSQGSLHESWRNYVDIRQGYLMKYNSRFADEAYAVYTTKDFEMKQISNGIEQGRRVSAFFTIPSSGSQKFNILVSCDDKCELWLRQEAEEGLDKEATSLDYVIKTWFKTNPNVYNKHDNQRSKTLSLSHCHMYYLEGYLEANREYQHMNVKLQPEGSNVHENLPKHLLFWTLPGKRSLHFKLSSTINGIIYARFRSSFTLQASYSFCCQGLFCPTCPMKLIIRVGLSQGTELVQSLPMDCLTHRFSGDLYFDIQPDSYELAIEYSFVGDTTKWSHRRKVGTLVVTENILANCSFLNGLCPGWKVDGNQSMGLWTPQKDFGIQMKSPGTSILQSPLLQHNYTSIKFCLKFAYKLPTNDTSFIKITNPNERTSTAIWYLNGFHGNNWNQAEVPLVELNNSKVIFTGFKSNNSSFIAIRNVQISTQICDLTPHYASRGEYIGCTANETYICCAYFKCSKAQFKCSNGECVSQASRCNGVYDGCRDGSDEVDCNCLSNQFRCTDECVTVDKVCDGRQDCWDGADEKYCHNRDKVCKEVTCFDGSCNTWSGACQCLGCKNSGKLEIQYHVYNEKIMIALFAYSTLWAPSFRESSYKFISQIKCYLLACTLNNARIRV
ncbi:uncharacterized protein LOC116303677 [Actinia tenebrosa]|uniref:Uncharacterized protein LOC116303677 n=1 Tax=Actinia tenebrosa TaxID=6105 RepID=A0A6P8IS99_ACTTE|nr:uncharacterized protein LOC116303677 [Actinia tenebrosa]